MIEIDTLFKDCRHCGTLTDSDDALCSEHCATRRVRHTDPEHQCPDDTIVTPELVARYEESAACPFCGSEANRDFGSYESTEDSVYQEISCETCECRWTDIYRFVGLFPQDNEEPVYMPADEVKISRECAGQILEMIENYQSEILDEFHNGSDDDDDVQPNAEAVIDRCATLIELLQSKLR